MSLPDELVENERAVSDPFVRHVASTSFFAEMRTAQARETRPLTDLWLATRINLRMLGRRKHGGDAVADLALSERGLVDLLSDAR